MSLAALMDRLRRTDECSAPAAVTPVTPSVELALQGQPAPLLSCTPVTPVTPLFDEVGRDRDSTAARAANDPAADPAGNWREADDAYQAHHSGCTVCKAAARGDSYGSRCTVGAALWAAYEAASAIPQPPKPTRAAFVPSITFSDDERRRLGIGATADEIDIMVLRLDRFARLGIAIDDAEKLADKLLLRDREGDDRRACVECAHYRGGRCSNWRQSGIDEPGRDLAMLLQRSAGFAEH